MSSFDDPPLPTAQMHAFGAISYFCLATSSLCANIVLAFALRKYRPACPSASAFLIITWQLAISDLVSQCVQLILAVPLTFTGQPLFGHGPLLNGIAFFDTLTYNSTLFFSALMTLNRLCVFFWPKLKNCMFQNPRIYISIAAIWFYVFVFCIALNLGGCRKAFAENGFYFFHNCTQPIPSFTIALRTYYSIASYYLPVAMLLAYLAIFAHLKLAKWRARARMNDRGAPALADVAELAREEQRASMERSVLIQSCLICGTLELQNVAFNLLTGLRLDGQWPYIVNIAENWASIANNSITAIVLFTFNAQIRSIAWRACHGQRRRTRLGRAEMVATMGGAAKRRQTSTFAIS